MERTLTVVREFISAQRRRLIGFFTRMAIARVLRNGPTARHHRSRWVHTVRQDPRAVAGLTRVLGEDVVTCVVAFWPAMTRPCGPSSELDDSDVEEPDLIHFAQHELEA